MSTPTRPALRIRLHPSGATFAAEPGQSVLEAAAAAGIRLPSSCRNGTCRACMCRRLAGNIDYRIEWPGLSLDEKDDGWMLPCVACARTDLEIEARPLPA
ncbi:2Fe-2S iron-sulfur cluster-binding protein [Cupriavidus sp. AU9028]|uniref:2Fe-2S iron-sulfur cluster-binding protein n=1 Tax=Cupriavidus sp. AU9028 TaxID=2871157 RepID=UPI001C962EB9|nr:2Fe-2S iron-sulfur cluster-binding protein [Cupriavidus sp. AU9028]MBY4896818.1 2Fe-2S iron-sulfur cluster binding domain-containing protein [Cupriavidus sp. AU9028]